VSAPEPTAAPSAAPESGRFYRALRMAVLVPLARLRFLFVLGAIGLLIVKWDDLVAQYEKYVRPVAGADAADPNHEYFCPMHPTVVRDTKKEKCPICFMPLSKRKKGDVGGGEALPAGTVARVQLTPYRITLAGVRTAPVEYHTLTREITTVGTVEFDERKLKAVSARVKGRIDTLHVNQTGQMVHAGDALAELYSPDLVVTVQNLLDAREAKNTVGEKLARDRLGRWGIDDKQIEAIVAADKPITHLTIRSPIKGHVLGKYVREGQYVEEGGLLFDVADRATVWVQAQLYEDDIALLPAGGHGPKTGKPPVDLKVKAATRAFPGRPFTGTLSFLFPHVDAETRTLTARFEVPNKDYELRPGMTATFTLKLDHDLLAKTPASRSPVRARHRPTTRRAGSATRLVPALAQDVHALRPHDPVRERAARPDAAQPLRQSVGRGPQLQLHPVRADQELQRVPRLQPVPRRLLRGLRRLLPAVVSRPTSDGPTKLVGPFSPTCSDSLAPELGTSCRPNRKPFVQLPSQGVPQCADATGSSPGCCSSPRPPRRWPGSARATVGARPAAWQLTAAAPR
jgi:multidrug efflux pump subunit AcrA (membrane-fusion protein)